MSNIMKVLIVSWGIVFAPAIAVSTIIHVPADEPTIQAGIDATVNGDTVLVADGSDSLLNTTVSEIVTNGMFSVLLGSIKGGISDTVLAGAGRYMEIMVGG